FSRDWSSDVCSSDLYVNNVLHGKQIYNAPTGKLTYEADYFAGKRHGLSKKYDHLGNPINSLQFEWGKENFVRTVFIPGINKKSRSEERRVGKEWRSR